MTDLVRIDLIPASDDHEEDELRAVWKAVYERRPPGTGIPVPLNLNLGLSTGLDHLYELAIPLAHVVVPAVAIVFNTWLKGRAGRKIRFRVDGVYIEAKTAEDVAMLVDAAKGLQEMKAKTPTKGKGAA